MCADKTYLNVNYIELSSKLETYKEHLSEIFIMSNPNDLLILTRDYNLGFVIP